MTGEIFRTFEEPVSAPDGTAYVAHICGRALANGSWEGWIEFVPEGDRPALRSRRETTQPNRETFDHWAQRLSAVYLDGALSRTLALERPRPPSPPARPPDRSRFEGPAPVSGPTREVAPDDAALNPFLAYRRGIDALRRELETLSASELRILLRGYHLDHTGGADIDELDRTELVDFTIEAVQERMA